MLNLRYFCSITGITTWQQPCKVQGWLILVILVRAASSILVHLGLGALSERTNLAEIARVAALERTFQLAQPIQRAWPVCQENMLQPQAWPSARPALQVGIKMQCKAIYVKHAPMESTVTIRLLVSKSHLVLTRPIASLMNVDVQTPNFAQKDCFATAQHLSRYHARLVKQQNFEAWHLVQSVQ